ncbi:MAG: PAS domain S-box protein [Firmicutes bacterium]|nr:PAS domain S-box protein [Bacillota bacterium]
MESSQTEGSAWREQLERVLEIIAEGIVIVGRDGRFLFANAAAERILGLKRSEIIGRTFADLKMKVTTIGGEPISEEDLHFTTVMQTGKPVYNLEHMHERPDGTKVIVSASAVPLFDISGNILVVVNSFTDITDRKRTEEELRESERRFREMLEKAELAAVMLDTQGRITFINDYLLNLTGWQRDEVIGRNWFSIFIPAEQQEQLKDFFFESLAKGEIQAHYKNDIVTSWDERRTISFTNVLLRDLQGNVIGTASIGEDVTERERAAEEIRASRRQVLDILESITDGFVAVDNDWRFTYVNAKAAQLLRRRKEDLLFRTIWDEFPEVVDTTFAKEFLRAVSENKPVVFEEFYPPLGRWFEVHAFPYKTGLSIYFRDISERKEREAKYKRKDELSDVLNNIGSIVNSELHFDKVMQAVISDSAKAIGAEAAAVKLREGEYWVVKYVYGLPEDLIGKQLSDNEAKAAALVLKTKNQLTSNDTYNDERLNSKLMEKYSIRSLLATPLIIKGSVAGVLIFSYRSAPVSFTELEADFASKVAVLLSLVLESARHYAAAQNRHRLSSADDS